MLEHTDLTIIKNAEGLPMALGYPINSVLLKNNKPLFVGGRGKSNGKENKRGKCNNDDTDFNNLAVPAGLVCMTETICKKPDEIGMGTDMNTEFDMHMPTYASDMDNSELIPDGLYENLLALAQETKPKKFTRRNHDKEKGNTKNVKKHKTQKHKSIKKK